MYKLKYDKNIDVFRIQFNEQIIDLSKDFYIKDCQCYAIHDYYPISGIGNDVDDNIKTIRNFIFNFKNGNNKAIDIAVKIIFNAIKKEGINLDNACLMIIPASHPEKTEKRFRSFCQMLSGNLRIINGYNYLTAIAHEETKGHGQKNILQYLSFNGKLHKDKNVLLFDDVTTSGSSFKQVAERLLCTGAQSVTGIFLAKTTRE